MISPSVLLFWGIIVVVWFLTIAVVANVVRRLQSNDAQMAKDALQIKDAEIEKADNAKSLDQLVADNSKSDR